MNKYSLLGIIFLISNLAIGQLATVTTEGLEVKSNSNDSLRSLLLGEFARVSRANSEGSIGNYIGINTKDDNLSFAYNWTKKHGLWELNASGGATDGITSFITDSKVNAGVKVGGKYKFLFFNGKKSDLIDTNKVNYVKCKYDFNRIDYLEKEAQNQQKESKMIADTARVRKELLALTQKKLRIEYAKLANESYIDKSLYISLSNKQKRLKVQLEILESRKDLIKNEILVELSRLSNRPKPANLIDSLKKIADSLMIIDKERLLLDSIVGAKVKIAAVNKEIEHNTVNELQLVLVKSKIKLKKIELEKVLKDLYCFSIKAEEKDNETKYSKQVHGFADEINSIRPKRIKISWLSLGMDLKYENFSLFDKALSIDSQIYKVDDFVPAINLSYTWYSNKSLKIPGYESGREIHYFSVGGTLKYANNIKSLTQIELRTTDSISPDRFLFNSQKAYSGNFRTNIVTANLYGDYYQFIGNKDNTGFHIRATMDFGDFAPIFSFRAGLLLSAVNIGKDKKERPLVNFEVFLGLNDVFKVRGEGNVLSRNVFGIQTTFPFGFNLKK